MWSAAWWWSSACCCRYASRPESVRPTQLSMWWAGLHATVCKKAPGRIAWHQVLNDIIWRSMGSAGIPATKEPSGLVRQDGKRPDGLTLIPWQGWKSLAWDVTVVSTLAQSYVDRTATGVGAVANSHSIFDFNFFAFNPWELYTQRYKNNNNN